MGLAAAAVAASPAKTILLINPNTSSATTRMMLDAASVALPPGYTIRGCQADRGVPMITTESELSAAAAEVVRIGRAEAARVDAIIVAAFGDPGVDALRDRVSVPVVGIAEAALLEAGAGGRSFGVATTTPALVRAIEVRVRSLGLAPQFTGVRTPPGDPLVLAAHPSDQDDALEAAVYACIRDDLARAVVIGGGPLSASATRLKVRFGSMMIAPLPASIRRITAA
jgi:Asp/Glu/hydantoin racemase